MAPKLPNIFFFLGGLLDSLGSLGFSKYTIILSEIDLLIALTINEYNDDSHYAYLFLFKRGLPIFPLSFFGLPPLFLWIIGELEGGIVELEGIIGELEGGIVESEEGVAVEGPKRSEAFIESAFELEEVEQLEGTWLLVKLNC